MRANLAHTWSALQIMAEPHSARNVSCCRSKVIAGRGVEHVSWQVCDHWSTLAMLQRL
jgi:hypothetical protein